MTVKDSFHSNWTIAKRSKYTGRRVVGKRNLGWVGPYGSPERHHRGNLYFHGQCLYVYYTLNYVWWNWHARVLCDDNKIRSFNHVVFEEDFKEEECGIR